MALANELVEVKRLPGIPNTLRKGSICVHPDGSTAFILDQRKNFFQVNLSTGEPSQIQITGLPQTFNSAQTIDLVAIVRSAELFIVGLTREKSELGKHVNFSKPFQAFSKRNKPSILFSIHIDNDRRKTEVVDEQDAGISLHKSSPTIFYDPYLHKDEEGRLFVLSCFGADANGRKTTFNATLVDVAGDGKIKTRSYAVGLLEGEWMLPFIYSGAMYCTPCKNSDLKEILKVFPSPSVKVAITVDLEDWKEIHFHFESPQVFGSMIFYSVYNSLTEVGFLLKLNLIEKRWERISIDMGNHLIDQYTTTFTRDVNGCLFMHGRCNFVSCTDKAHIYAIKMKTAEIAKDQGATATISLSKKSPTQTPRSTVNSAVLPKTRSSSQKFSNSLIQVRRLNGINKAFNCLAVHPDGSFAYLFDTKKKWFMKVDLSTGENTFVETEQGKDFESARVVEFVAVTRSFRLFILALIDKLVSSFYLNVNIDRISLADEQYTGIELDGDNTCIYFQLDQQGQCYVLSHVKNSDLTVFSVSVIDISYYGEIETTVLFSNRLVDCHVCTFFIHLNALYFVPYGQMAMTKLLKTSLTTNEPYLEVDVKNDVKDLISSTFLNWSNPQIVDDNIFYYVYSRSEGIGYLLNLNIRVLRWQQVFVDMGTHILFWPSLAVDNKEFLYLRGICRDETCDEKTHIYVIDTETVEKYEPLSIAPVIASSQQEPSNVKDSYVEIPDDTWEEEEEEEEEEEHEHEQEQEQGQEQDDEIELVETVKYNKEIIAASQLTNQYANIGSLSVATTVKKGNSSAINIMDDYRWRKKPTLPAHSAEPQKVNANTQIPPNANVEEVNQDSKEMRRSMPPPIPSRPSLARPKIDINKTSPLPEIPMQQTSDRSTEASQESETIQRSEESGDFESGNWVPDSYSKDIILGEGNYGVAYKCWNAERRRYFVAKKATAKSEGIKSSLNEIKRLKDLSHPRIIEYYGYKNEDDGMVIFMEYMPLGSIRDVMKEHGPVIEKTAIIYIEQVLDGLEYLHKKGIVHSDLKCDNLLSDHNGNIKIGDFGLAVQKKLSSANISYFNPHTEGLGGGAHFWIDPEFFETQAISRKSDLWSLGCTIVEMLTTKPPYFELGTPYKLITARAKNLLSYDPKELVPDVTEPMQSFIECLLQIDSADRPVDAAEATKKFRIHF